MEKPSKLEKILKRIDEITSNPRYLGVVQIIVAGGFLYNGIKYQDSHKLYSAIWYVSSGISLANGVNNLFRDV